MQLAHGVLKLSQSLSWQGLCDTVEVYACATTQPKACRIGARTTVHGITSNANVVTPHSTMPLRQPPEAVDGVVTKHA